MYVEQSRYARHLRAWLDYFPPGEALIVLQEEIRDPSRAGPTVYEFLEHHGPPFCVARQASQ